MDPEARLFRTASVSLAHERAGSFGFAQDRGSRSRRVMSGPGGLRSVKRGFRNLRSGFCEQRGIDLPTPCRAAGARALLLVVDLAQHAGLLECQDHLVGAGGLHPLAERLAPHLLARDLRRAARADPADHPPRMVPRLTDAIRGPG